VRSEESNKNRDEKFDELIKRQGDLKVTACSECAEEFDSILELTKHFKEKHQLVEVNIETMQADMRLQMQTKTQSYDIGQSKQFGQIKVLREILLDHNNDYKLGHEFEENNDEAVKLDDEKAIN
jgi:hypothetical protein